jgi:hypothetical protein
MMISSTGIVITPNAVATRLDGSAPVPALAMLAPRKASHTVGM